MQNTKQLSGNGRLNAKTSFCKERLNFEHFGNATQNDARNRLHLFSGVRHVVSLEIPSIEQDRQK